MGYELYTRNGHNLLDMASLYQKSIRRGDWKLAAYAAGEIHPKYSEYLWRRTLVIAAEDCHGCISQEIYALYQSDREVNSKKRAGKPKTRIFISKAIVLLLTARKNRDADFLTNRVMDDEELGAEAERAIELMDEKERIDELPEWVYDIHTKRGRKSGRTKEEFLRDEFESLANRQMGLFDDRW